MTELMPEPFLEPEHITKLTKKKRRPAQLRVLKGMQIEHKVRPDGSIAILWAHISKVFDGNPSETPRKTNKTASPNWEALTN